jgi:hypothetical protein
VTHFLFGLLLAFVPLLSGSPQQGKLDSAFDDVPFDQWMTERAQSSLRLAVNVSHPELTFHQRLEASVQIEVDGKDLENRRRGELIFYVQITARDGSRYQNHGSLDLTKLDQNVKAATIQYSYRAFFLPGDYSLAIAIVDSVSKERTISQGHFRIASLPQDTFAAEWRHLPPVEFIGAAESPDSWYLPGVKGRLEWAGSVEKPARLNIILTIAPSVTLPGTRATPSGGLPALIPTLKVISHPASPDLSENLEVLDIARHRAVFKQEDMHSLDWRGLKSSLGEANTVSIDVGSLADSHHDAQFFVSEVRRLLRDSPQPCELVVLSTAIAFASGEDLEPISLEAMPPCKVTYIRYHGQLPVVNMFGRPQGGGRFGRGGRMDGPMARPRSIPEPVDKLAATLKPLNPKVIDVDSPEEMNHALSEIQKRF